MKIHSLGHLRVKTDVNICVEMVQKVQGNQHSKRGLFFQNVFPFQKRGKITVLITI